MELPGLRYVRRKRTVQEAAFGGLDLREGAPAGSLRSSEGLTARRYPALETREARREARRLEGAEDLFGWEELVCIAEGVLWYGEERIGPLPLGAGKRRQWAVVNTKLCIFPDKVYLDLEDKCLKSLEVNARSGQGTRVTFTESSITMEPDRVVERGRKGKATDWTRGTESEDRDNGKNYIKRYKSVAFTAGEGWRLEGEEETWVRSLQPGDLVMLRTVKDGAAAELDIRRELTDKDTGAVLDPGSYGTPDGEGRYGVIENVDCDSYADAKINEVFITVAYDMHSAADASGSFGELASGDRVDILGCEAHGENNVERAEVKRVDGYTLELEGAVLTPGEETARITVRRTVPDLKFICESGNRLWGCEGHTIWASALGLPTRFYDYDGLSTDSYAVAVGSAGEFTGCSAYSEGVLFWKEGLLHKVLGSCPANYEVNTYRFPGVQAGSEGSLQVMDEVLYYKGVEGVYAYTGGTPRLISACFGPKRFTGGAAVGGGGEYRISLRDEEGEWGLYVFDAGSGIWLRESGEKALAFAAVGERRYLLSAGSGGAVMELSCADGQERFRWGAELRAATEGELQERSWLRLRLRMELAEGSWCDVEVRHGKGTWKWMRTIKAQRRELVELPLPPVRCESLGVRLRGEGECVIRGMEREYL